MYFFHKSETLLWTEKYLCYATQTNNLTVEIKQFNSLKYGNAGEK
jgi:hypothetical protein